MDSLALNNNPASLKTQIESNQNEALKNKLQAAKNSKDDQELRDVSKQFEAVFINMLLKNMRSTIPEDQGYIEKSNATKTYESMLDEEMAEQMSKAGGIGLSDMIYKSLVKRAEIENSLESGQVANVDIKEAMDIKDTAKINKYNE